MAEMSANGALAEHIARVGRLPVVDLFTWQGAPPPTNTSSTLAVTHLEHAIQFNSAIQVPDGPVLLCAVTMRSGWTLTVCAALLYETAGNKTLPLVIHRLP